MILLTHPGVGTRLTSLLLLLAGCAWPQADSGPLPRFEDYPASGVYTGPLAVPKLLTPIEQRYAGRIRDGVEKGHGVFRNNTNEHQGPNFAGDMIVIQWPCGAPCLRMAIVDAQNGDVHYPPISARGIGVPSFDLPLLQIANSVSQNPEVLFRANSRLMIIKATPNWWLPGRHPAVTYCYLWQQNHWTLLRKAPSRTH